MAEDSPFDQETYDKLIAEGKPERIARAKAKAAAVRQQRAEQAAEAPASSEEGAGAPAASGGEAAGAASQQPAAQPAAAAGGGGGGGALTAEERQARVQAALAKRGGPPGGDGGEARLAGQSHTHRLLAMVPPSGIQQIQGKQQDKVYTWPHLIGAEFVALMALTAAITAFSAFAPAPLQDMANPNVTPNPAKAPWYFLGLQELLAYFHPMIAGVTIPGIVGLLGLMLIPYIDKNPSVKPENRKTAYSIFTIFLVGSAVLTLIGSFFRGPGFNWTWPWVEGIWFVL